MVEHLRLRWRDDMPMEALLGLRDELDDMLERIRSTRHMSNPVFKCPACGHIGRGADPQISVRATILALARFGVAAAVLRGLLAAEQRGAKAIALFLGENRTFDRETRAGACRVDSHRDGALDDRYAARAL